MKDSNVSTRLITLARKYSRYTTLNQHSSVYWLMTSFVRSCLTVAYRVVLPLVHVRVSCM